MSSSAQIRNRLLSFLLLPLLILSGTPAGADCCCRDQAGRSGVEDRGVREASFVFHLLWGGVEVASDRRPNESSGCCAKSTLRSESGKASGQASRDGSAGDCENCRCRLDSGRRIEEPFSIAQCGTKLVFVLTRPCSNLELPLFLGKLSPSDWPQLEDRAHPPPLFLLYRNFRC